MMANVTVDPVKVSPQDYDHHARDFVDAQGKGFMICGDEIATTPDVKCDPRTWGAWIAYFHMKGLVLHLRAAKSRGRYMVPTKWPHQFDIDWNEEQDNKAADMCEAITAKRERGVDNDRKQEIIRAALADFRKSQAEAMVP